MPVNYGDFSVSRGREITASDTRIMNITLPTTGQIIGHPVYITYNLESDEVIIDPLVDVEYSTDNSTWQDCTALPGDPAHDGVINLSADADANEFTFVWDTLTDLGGTYTDTSVYIRVRGRDTNSRWSPYITTQAFSVLMLPTVTISSPTASVVEGYPVYVEYSIASNLPSVVFAIQANYSTDGGSNWSTATALTADPLHDGVSGLAAGASTFVWNSSTDLGNSYSGSTVVFRIRANNSYGYGEWGSSDVFKLSMLPVAAISSPLATDELGSPIYVEYSLTTYRASPVVMSITAQFSDDGSTWATATPDTGDPLHDGLTGFVTGSYTFVWDSATDLGTNFQGSTVYVRLLPNDGTNNGLYATSLAFTVDMLPTAPTLISPFDTYFDAGDQSDPGNDFIFTVPEDPGSDRMILRIQIDQATDFASAVVDINSQDDAGRFMHRQSTAAGYKNAANGLTYYIKGLSVTSATGTAVLFSSLVDHHTDGAVASTLVNPQILLVNRAERRSYIPQSSITTTGFTIYKKSFGSSTDGEVDLLIFSGATGTFDSYWVNLTVTGTAAHVYGAGSFVTDLLGRSIPASIAYCVPEILEGSDRGVYLTSIGDTGFTVNLSGFGGSATALIRVCLRATPSEVYQHRTQAATSGSTVELDFNNSLDDYTNGGAAFPDYLPGTIVTVTDLVDRPIIVETINNDYIGVYKAGYGGSANSSFHIQLNGQNDTTVPYYTDVSPYGVPDSYEDNYVRCRLTSEDALAQDFYFWRAVAGNP